MTAAPKQTTEPGDRRSTGVGTFSPGRVLVLNYEFPPLGGGAGHATYYITRELVSMGWTVDVVTAHWGDILPERPDGVEVFSVPTTRKGIHSCGLKAAAQYICRALPVVRRLASERQYDLTHSFFSLPTGVLSLDLWKRARIPYVVSLRGSDVPGYDPGRDGQLLHRLCAPITRRVWQQAGAVVTNSPALKELAVRFLDMPMDIIGNAVDISVFSPPGRPPTRAEDGLRVVCVSRLIKRKGVQHLLEAVARTPEVARLDIIGSGSYEENLHALAQQLELGDRVHFIGHVKHQELPAIYARYDLFALPSMAESFGIVFAEAMACGLPILGANEGGIPSVVRDGIDGILVEPADVDGICDALRFFAADEDRRYEMGRAGRQRIEEQFTWQQVARKYEAIYNRVRSAAAQSGARR
ncbi:MAG: glycosyltransferase family 4 protein [Armatimonadetes bacterium]|nr:glycosyltransferase family 4 protein [Armatimonadota bacterium]